MTLRLLIAAWFAALLWLILDPAAEQVVRQLLDRQFWTRPLDSIRGAAGTWGTGRSIGLGGLFVLLGLAAIHDAHQRWRRRAPKLTVRRLLIWTTLIGAWCGMGTAYEQIGWQGKRLRSIGRVDAIDHLARRLDTDWPQQDGEIPELGPFLAYPFGDPTVLLLLSPYPLDGTQTVIAAIERSHDGVLRFQLGGKDGGDWIEWHRRGLRPTSVTGGLSDHRGLKHYATLGGEFYLVRYDSS